MHVAEDMMKVVGPYALKRGFRILKRKVTGEGFDAFTRWVCERVDEMKHR